MVLYFIDDDHAAHVYHNIMLNEVANDISASNFYSVNHAIDSLKVALASCDISKWPDAIILDINMPLKTGWEFLEEYALLPKLDKLTRIFLSTNSENPADIIKAEENALVEGYKLKYVDSSFFQMLFEEHAKN